MAENRGLFDRITAGIIDFVVSAVVPHNELEAQNKKIPPMPQEAVDVEKKESDILDQDLSQQKIQSPFFASFDYRREMIKNFEKPSTSKSPWYEAIPNLVMNLQDQVDYLHEKGSNDLSEREQAVRTNFIRDAGKFLTEHNLDQPGRENYTKETMPKILEAGLALFEKAESDLLTPSPDPAHPQLANQLKPAQLNKNR